MADEDVNGETETDDSAEEHKVGTVEEARKARDEALAAEKTAEQEANKARNEAAGAERTSEPAEGSVSSEDLNQGGESD